MKEVERIISKVMIPKKCECTFCGKEFYSYVTHGIESYVSKTNNTGIFLKNVGKTAFLSGSL